MRTLLTTTGATLLLALGACTTMPGARPSTMMTPAAAGGAAAMPQSANSLPVGDTVNAPRASSTGAVANTPVRP